MTTKTKKKATEKDQLYQVRDEAPAKYFTGYWKTPNIVEKMALTLAEYRLYQHYRQVCSDGGADGGECWQGVRGLAATCKMSKPTVIKAKRSLATAGLIRIEATMRETGRVKHPAEIITLVDIWGLNYEFCVNKKQELGKKEVTRLGKKEVTKQYPVVNKTPLNNNNRVKVLGDLNGVYDFLRGNIEAGSNGHNLEEARKLATEYTPEWLLEAMKAAVEAGSPNIGYTKGILKDWAARGFKAPAPVRQGKKAIPQPCPTEKKPMDGFVILGSKK